MKTTIAVYNEFAAQLAELKGANEKLTFDYESKEGNKAARSHIYKLRQTKAAVEKARKAEKAASLEYGRKVDSEAKEIVSEIEQMIEVHQGPIDEIEQREKDRIAKHKDHIEGMISVANQTEHPDFTPLSSCEYMQAIKYIEEIQIDDSWDEFISEAAKIKDESLATLRKRYDERLKYEKEQSELADLRRKQEEAEQRERDEKIAKEAERRALAEAEEKAKREKEAAERRELELKLAAERAEKEKLEAERRAEIAKEEAIEAARKAEEERKKKEAEEAEKRETNKRHAAKINNAAASALVKECGISQEIAKEIIVAIAKKQIPNVSITY